MGLNFSDKTDKLAASHPIVNLQSIKERVLFNRFFALFFLVIPFTWAGSFIAGKFVVVEMDVFSSVMFRFLLSAIVMLPGLALFHRKKHPAFRNRSFLFHLAIVVLFSGLGYHLFFFSALQYTIPTKTALIIALNPFFTAFAEILLFRQTRPKRFYFGFMLAFAGAVWVILSRGNTIDLSMVGKGELFCLLAALSWTIYTLGAKKTKAKNWDSMWINGYNYLFTGLLMMPLAGGGLEALFALEISANGWAGLWYMAIFPTAIGYTLFYVGVQRRGPAWAVTYIYLVPSVTAVLDFLFFKQHFSPVMMLATLLVVIGLIVGNVTERQLMWLKYKLYP